MPVPFLAPVPLPMPVPMPLPMPLPMPSPAARARVLAPCPLAVLVPSPPPLTLPCRAGFGSCRADEGLYFHEMRLRFTEGVCGRRRLCRMARVKRTDGLHVAVRI